MNEQSAIQPGAEPETEKLVLSRVVAAGIIPVIELPSVQVARPLMEALLDGGLSAVEITLRTPAGIDALSVLRQDYPDLLLCAGTVRRPDDVRRVVAAGADLIISPAVNVDLLAASRHAGVVAVPGVCTPTEIDMAVNAGARVLKFFPAAAIGGVPFLRAVSAPFRDVLFIPTGGINSGNLRTYLECPQVIACGGSWMVAPDLIRAQRFTDIASLAREAASIVREVRDAVAA